MTDPLDCEIAVFGAARRLPPGERSAYLHEACAGNAALRRQVEELLHANEEAADFLQEPAPGALRPEPASTASTPVPAPGEQAGDRIGRYKLLQQIGEGGCGVVYMAEQEEPVRRRVALKVIKLGMDTKSVIARFEAERQALAMMDHPNIARVLDAGATETGRPYFVMELVRGIKITDFCDEHNLSTTERLKLFIQICHAVQHAHQKGIIHRDLKPSNILVASDDIVTVPKVIDFGIAKATQGRLTDRTLFTAFEQFIGTPAYMSPEQAELTMQDVDTRTDIYSLGVLLYELLTGKTPFDAQQLLSSGLDAMRRTIREVEPVKPSTKLTHELVGDDVRGLHSKSAKPKSEGQIRDSSCRLLHRKDLIRQLRGDLDWIVMKCLEKDRARRYETVNGLARDIERHLNKEPVGARPPSAFYRLQKGIQRNRAAFGAAAGIAGVLLIGAGVSTSEAIRAARQKQEQMRLKQIAETKEKKSERVSRFLKEILRSVSPSVAQGRDTTLMSDIADDAARRIGTDLKDEPEVELELRFELLRLYVGLGLHPKAETMAQEILRVARRHLGEMNLLVADTLGYLGYVLCCQGRTEEAEEVTRKAIAMERTLRGRESVEEGRALRTLGDVLREQAHLRPGEFTNKIIQAEKIIRDSKDMYERVLGHDSDEFAWTLHRLNVVLENEGKIAEAEEVISNAIAIWERIRPGGDQGTVSCYDRLAKTLLMDPSTNRLLEAESCLRKAVEVDEKINGGKPSEPYSHRDLAEVFAMQDKFDDAETHYSEAVALARSRYGPDGATLPWFLTDLASLLRQRGKLTEARQAAEEAVDICQRVPERIHLRDREKAFAALKSVLKELGDTAALEKLEATRQLPTKVLEEKKN
jgi:serine/threonine protein kinase/tetratricopeptide (TPR) repeat protein